MKVIGLYTVHDSNISVSVDGEIKVALELERLTGIKHYWSPTSKKEFIRVWAQAIGVVTDYVGIKHFDVCVSNSVGRKQMKILKELINADRWVEERHHPCHASIGFYDSPFNSALVISTDGMGNETACEVFSGTRDHGIKSLEQCKTMFGKVYNHIGAMLPEVVGENFWEEENEDRLTESFPSTDLHFLSNPERYMDTPGKKMGYAALGTVKKEWMEGMRFMYSRWNVNPKYFYWSLIQRLSLNDLPEKDVEKARDLAATSQYMFSEAHCELVAKHLEKYYSDPKNPPLDGIVVTGGCGQNVCNNQLILEKFGFPVHVACAPNDAGIATGACWLVEPPRKHIQIMYAGLPVFDHDRIDEIAKQRNARKYSISEIADILMEHKIIGVVRGRAEYGARALGNRSLLTYPDRPEQLDRINKLKNRRFYRPACPSVTEESAVKIFKGRLESDKFVSHESHLELYEHDDRFCNGKNIVQRCDAACQYPDSNPANFVPRSPYMSFAPSMRDECRAMFPACCHFDNTARLQTVTKKTNPWFHSLLQEIGKRNGGYDILINTSFNVKGQPILNYLRDAMEMLDKEEHLEYVICDDWLFSKRN